MEMASAAQPGMPDTREYLIPGALHRYGANHVFFTGKPESVQCGEAAEATELQNGSVCYKPQLVIVSSGIFLEPFGMVYVPMSNLLQDQHFKGLAEETFRLRKLQI